MTVATKNSLLERVARAVVEVRRGYNNGDGQPLSDERWLEMRDWYLKFKDDPDALSARASLPAFGYEAAQAALDACQVEEMQRLLRRCKELRGASFVNAEQRIRCWDALENQVTALLAKLDGRS